MGKRPHTCFGGGIGRRSEDSAHTWRSRLATNGLHAGSSPAQSTWEYLKKASKRVPPSNASIGGQHPRPTRYGVMVAQ